jgi:anti-sigma factor RsiW
MNCEACREGLLEYHDRSLEPERERAIAEHLAGCASCALAYARLDADRREIGALLTEAPRKELKAELRAKVAARFRPPWPRRLMRLLAAPIPAYQAALVFSAALIAWVLITTRAPSSAPAPIASPPLSKSGAHEVLDHFDASTTLAIDPNLL